LTGCTLSVAATRLATSERTGAAPACTTRPGERLAVSPCTRTCISLETCNGSAGSTSLSASSSSRIALQTLLGRPRSGARTGCAAMVSWRVAQFSKPTSRTAWPRILGREAMGAAPVVPLTPWGLLKLRAGPDVTPGREWRGAELVGRLLGPEVAMLLPLVVSIIRVAMGAALEYGLALGDELPFPLRTIFLSQI